MSSNDDKLLTKEEHLANYIKTFVAIEDAMEPFKEQRKDSQENLTTRMGGSRNRRCAWP